MLYAMCNAHNVSSNAESEAPAVARWAALVSYTKSRGSGRGGRGDSRGTCPPNFD